MIDDSLREELSALIDGVLPEGRAKELRKRIREDAELSREYAELERAVLAVRAIPRRGAPAELRARLDASLGSPRAKGRIFRLAGLAAAAVVLVAAGLALYLRDGSAPAHFEATDKARRQGAEDRNERPPAPAEEALGRAQADEAESGLKAASRESAAREAPPAAKAKLGKASGAEKQESRDLVDAVLRSREIKAEDRKAYLTQLGALGAEKARAHVLGVFGRETDLRDERELLPEAPGGGTPVLATILLEDREEADLVKKALGLVPRARLGAAPLLTVEADAKEGLSAEVEGTPEDLRRIARWLALLDLSREDAMRPKVTVLDEAKRGAKEAEPAVRTAVVRLRYGKPPEPQPAESPPGK